MPANRFNLDSRTTVLMASASVCLITSTSSPKNPWSTGLRSSPKTIWSMVAVR